jgi:hypothetical protein
MNNRTAERAGSRRSRVAVIHPLPFVVKFMHMRHLKTKSPCGSNIAITQFLPQMVRGYYSHAAIHPAPTTVGAGILAGE